MIPSLKGGWWKDGKKPAIQVLEVGQKNLEPVYVLIERTESQTVNKGQLDKATIEITYQVINQDPYSHECEGGEFDACYHRENSVYGECVRLTSSSITNTGFVVIDPDWLQGSRLGTYLMNELVTWAQQWPNADILEICTLISGRPSPGNTNTGRRNPFYEQFGIRFHKGVSKPMKVQELNTVDRWESNIKEIPLDQFLAHNLGQLQYLRGELNARERSLNEISEEWTFAITKPIRWALHRIFQ